MSAIYTVYHGRKVLHSCTNSDEAITIAENYAKVHQTYLDDNSEDVTVVISPMSKATRYNSNVIWSDDRLLDE